MTDTLTTIETVPMPIGPFFRFPDEAAWTEAATEAGFFSEPDEDGNTTLAAYTNDRAIDVVGVITRGGEYDPETGDVIVAPEVLDGWHVNYVGNCLMGGRSLRCIRQILSGCGLKRLIRPT
jgi:hypothetical protein